MCTGVSSSHHRRASSRPSKSTACRSRTDPSIRTKFLEQVHLIPDYLLVIGRPPVLSQSRRRRRFVCSNAEERISRTNRSSPVDARISRDTSTCDGLSLKVSDLYRLSFSTYGLVTTSTLFHSARFRPKTQKATIPHWLTRRFVISNLRKPADARQTALGVLQSEVSVPPANSPCPASSNTSFVTSSSFPTGE